MNIKFYVGLEPVTVFIREHVPSRLALTTPNFLQIDDNFTAKSMQHGIEVQAKAIVKFVSCPRLSTSWNICRSNSIETHFNCD